MSNTLRYWNGTEWVVIGGGTGSGYYGTFYDTTNQTAASTTVAYPIKFNTDAEPGHGVYISNDNSGNPTKINFENAGTYNVQFSIQLVNRGANIADVSIWLRKNGTTSAADVQDSSGYVAVTGSHGGINGQTISSWNYVLTVAAGDYFNLMWSTDDVHAGIEVIAAGTSPVNPVSPSVILTVTEVAGSGPQGPQGLQGSQGVQGYQGVPGLAGTTGAQGLTGPQGSTGYQGTPGIDGLNGNDGPQGTTGSQGYQGHQGYQGYQGMPSSVQGPQGYQGYQGAYGGPQGYQGNQGSQGLQGSQGSPSNLFINALDHGIVADAAFGSGTDNAAAINALIQSSSTPKGATIYFPASNTSSSFNGGNTSYGIKSAIELIKDVTLVGDNNGIVMFNALPGFTDTAMLRTFSSTDYKTLVTDTGCTLTNGSKVVLDSNASNTYVGSLITSTTYGIPLNTQIAACTPGVSYTMVNAFIGSTTTSASISTGGKSIYAPASLTSSTNNIEPKVQSITFNFNNRCNNVVAIQIAQINERGFFQNVTVQNYEYQTFAQAQLNKFNYGLIGVAIWGGVGRSVFDHFTCYGYGFQHEFVIDATNGGYSQSFMADIAITNYTSAPRVPDGLGHGDSIVYARGVNALYVDGHMESMAPNNALPATWSSGSTPTTWQASAAYTLNQPIVYKGMVYWATRAGTTGSTVPGGFVLGPWQPNTSYTLGQRVSAGQGSAYCYEVTSYTTGISGSTPPNFAGYSSPITDGGVTWTQRSGIQINDPSTSGVQWTMKGQVPYIPDTSWTASKYVTSAPDTNSGGTTLQPGGSSSPYLYTCIQDGKTGLTEPSWPNILGAQVVDGAAVTAVSLVGTTLNLASVSGFSTSGVGTLTHSGVVKTFSYTGVSGNSLTGIAWVGGTPTVSSGDEVLVGAVWICSSVDCNSSASIETVDCPDSKINVAFKGDQSTAILRPVVRATVTSGFYTSAFTANSNPIGSPVLDHCQVSTQTHNKFLNNFIEDYTGGLTRVMAYSPQTMDPYWISYDGVSYTYANRPTPETATTIVTKQFVTNLSMGGNKITNVANGTNAGDAVNFAQLSAVGAVPLGSLNVKSCVTTAAINSGTAYTSISIAACPQPMNSGSQLNLLLYSAGAVTTQTVTLSADVAAGATSLSVNSFTASSTFPSGTELIPFSASLPINTIFPGATKLKVTVVGGGAGGGGAGGATGTTLQAGGGGGAMGSWTEQVVGTATNMTSVRLATGGYGGTSGAPGGAGGAGGAGGSSSAVLNGVTVSSGGGGNGAGSNANSATTVGGGIWGRQGSSTTVSAFSAGPSGLAGSIAVGYSGGSGSGGGAATATIGGGGGNAGLGVSTTGVPAAGTSGGSGSGSTGANGTSAAINSAAGGGGGGGGAAGTGNGGVGGAGGSGYIVIEVVG